MNETVYGGSFWLQDYISAWATVRYGPLLCPDQWDDSRVAQVFKDKPVLGVQEYYKDCVDQNILDDIEKYFEKVRRINKLCTLVNAPCDLRTLKRAYNELNRLLYGMDAGLGFNEPESHPDLLQYLTES